MIAPEHHTREFVVRSRSVRLTSEASFAWHERPRTNCRYPSLPSVGISKIPSAMVNDGVPFDRCRRYYTKEPVLCFVEMNLHRRSLLAYFELLISILLTTMGQVVGRLEQTRRVVSIFMVRRILRCRRGDKARRTVVQFAQACTNACVDRPASVLTLWKTLSGSLTTTDSCQRAARLGAKAATSLPAKTRPSHDPPHERRSSKSPPECTHNTCGADTRRDCCVSAAMN